MSKIPLRHRLLAARLRANLSQEALGRRLGHEDGAWVSRTEAGKHSPTIETLQKIARITETPITDLLP
jgi:transcriptional regulator with XRE-family HTH domain